MLRRALVVLAVLVAGWLVLCFVLFVFPWSRGSAPARADAVVVLSGERARLRPALALVRRGEAPVLAISSIQKTPHWLEARRLCSAGHYAGAKVVCFLAVPYSTRGEARAVARLARERRWRSIVVVTSTFHITRAKLLFRRCYAGGLTFVGSPSPWWRQPLDWADETAKLAVQLTVERGC